MKRRWDMLPVAFGLAATLTLMIGPGCAVGGGGHTGGYQQIIPAGNITSLSPSSVVAGGPPFTLTINGNGFTYAQYVVLNGGTPIPVPSSRTDTQIAVSISASMIVNPGTISVVLTTNAPATKPSNTVSLAINPLTTTACALFGTYDFLFTGFDKNGPMVAAGAFGVDANGNVNGEEDLVEARNIFTPPGSAFTGGKCTNSAKNQGTLTMSLISVNQITETFTYTFVLQQGGTGLPRGRYVETNDLVDPDNILGTISGSGMFVQVPANASLSGDYTFGAVGTDHNVNRMSEAGRFTYSNGNLSSGVIDINDAGTIASNVALSGATPAVGPVDLFSRISINATAGEQSQAWAVYANSSTSGFIIVIPSPGPSLPYSGLGGEVSSQSNAGAYTNASLNAPVVYNTWGLVSAPAASDTTLGLASGFDSTAGTFNLQFDNVSGGTASLDQAVNGATYSVDSNGRTTVSYTVNGNPANYIYYLDDSNDGFIVGTGSTVEFGYFQPQAPGPFTAASINGAFATATFLPTVSTSPNLATEITLNNGTLSANTPAGALSGTYTVSNSGRGTASVNLPVFGSDSLVIYVIGPDSVALMGSGNTTSDALAFMNF